MSISRERVRQVEVKAKERLRKIFDEWRAVRSPSKGPVIVGSQGRDSQREH